MLRFVVLRFGLLNTLLWSCLVINLAVLALLLGPLGAFSRDDATEIAARGEAAAPEARSNPGADDDDDAVAGARRQGRQNPASGEGSPAAPVVPEGPRPGDAPLLCGPQEALAYSSKGRVAVAADRSGHFTLYGGADPETGRPTEDSYDLLRDCSPELSFANSTMVRVDGGEPEPAGARNDAAATREAADGDLSTVYRFAGGVEMAQALRLVDEEGPGGAALEISYRLSNRSQETRTVGLRGLLNPPIWVPAPERPAYRAPAIAEKPLREGGRKNGRIVTERTMLGEEARAPFYVPRRGAASDSSGRWEPGTTGPPPDGITFAGSLRFLRAPFFYEARLGYALPPNSAFAAYWTGIRLGPGQELTVSHRYVAAPAPLPPPEADASSREKKDERGPRDAR